MSQNDIILKLTNEVKDQLTEMRQEMKTWEIDGLKTSTLNFKTI
jgi:hypothetical protein